MDDTNFGSSLGGKPVSLHKIHDHHMVFQLCTKRFDLKSWVDDCVRVAGHIPFLMSFCRNSRLLHDTWNPVTSASEPGKHNFLCFIQVSSAAGGTWKVPELRPLPEFSSSRLRCLPTPAVKHVGSARGNLEGDLYVPWKYSFLTLSTRLQHFHLCSRVTQSLLWFQRHTSSSHYTQVLNIESTRLQQDPIYVSSPSIQINYLQGTVQRNQEG